MAEPRFPCASREITLGSAAAGAKNELLFTPLMLLAAPPSEPWVPRLPALSQVVAMAFRAQGQIMLVRCSAE